MQFKLNLYESIALKMFYSFAFGPVKIRRNDWLKIHENEVDRWRPHALPWQFFVLYDQTVHWMKLNSKSHRYSVSKAIERCVCSSNLPKNE